MLRRLICGLLSAVAALVLTLALVPAAGASSVSVRIVGDGVGLDSKLVDTTGVTVPGGCAGNSAGEAIELATAGNWDRNPFVATILGESHTYVDSDYWSFWINDTYSQAGICAYTVSPGDRILMFVQHDNASFMGTIFPLTLAGIPAQVTAGSPFTVTVNEQRTDGTTTTPTPLAGATVAGGGTSAQTDAAGHATLTLATAGTVTLRATHSGNVASDAVALAVQPENGPPTVPLPCVTNGRDGSCGSRDLTAPVATIVGIKDGQRFTRSAAPRTLRVRVSERSALRTVKLRLTRTDGRRCTYFSGGSERFKLGKHGACGAQNGFWFGVGAAEQTDYLLPSKLPRGRYVLDANAIDQAYNRDDTRRRGANRVVFSVA